MNSWDWSNKGTGVRGWTVLRSWFGDWTNCRTTHEQQQLRCQQETQPTKNTLNHRSWQKQHFISVWILWIDTKLWSWTWDHETVLLSDWSVLTVLKRKTETLLSKWKAATKAFPGSWAQSEGGGKKKPSCKQASLHPAAPLMCPSLSSDRLSAQRLVNVRWELSSSSIAPVFFIETRRALLFMSSCVWKDRTEENKNSRCMGTQKSQQCKRAHSCAARAEDEHVALLFPSVALHERPNFSELL